MLPHLEDAALIETVPDVDYSITGASVTWVDEAFTDSEVWCGDEFDLPRVSTSGVKDNGELFWNSHAEIVVRRVRRS